MFDFSREEGINKERIKRLVDWYKGQKKGPIQLDVELHKTCNLNCIFCSRHDCHQRLNRESLKNKLSTEKWLKIIDEANDLNALVFNIEGINEPPAIPELFFPVIEKVKEIDMYGIVTTNGVLWKKSQLKNLVDIGWDRIHFSIHSSNSKIHDRLVGMNGAWKKAVDNIKILNKWKEEFESQRPMLNINICINRLNYQELPEMVELAHNLGVDYIFTEPLMIYHSEGKSLKLDKNQSEELSSLKRKASDLAKKYEIDNNFATQDKNLEEEIVQQASKMDSLLIKDVEGLDEGLISSPCFKAWDRIVIRYNGKTGHCGFVEKGENIKERSLKDIWFGEFFQTARKRMINKELFPHCSKCVPSDFTQRRRFRKRLINTIEQGEIG